MGENYEFNYISCFTLTLKTKSTKLQCIITAFNHQSAKWNCHFQFSLLLIAKWLPIPLQRGGSGWLPISDTQGQHQRADLEHLPGTSQQSHLEQVWSPCRGGGAPTCQTRCSLAPGIADRQMLSTMVWEEEVRTLAMMASRMLKGSMVYTTKMMKRKNDTYRWGGRTVRVTENACSQTLPLSFPLKAAQISWNHSHSRNNITTKRGHIQTNPLRYTKGLTIVMEGKKGSFSKFGDFQFWYPNYCRH